MSMLKGMSDFLFGSVLGKAAAFAGLFAFVVGWWQLDRMGQRRVGREQAIQKVERNNVEHRARADSAGSKSLSGAGGLLNPHYRD